MQSSVGYYDVLKYLKQNGKMPYRLMAEHFKVTSDSMEHTLRHMDDIGIAKFDGEFAEPIVEVEEEQSGWFSCLKEWLGL